MNNLWLKDNLTSKQKEYVSLLASGLTTLQISEKNFVSHHTVRNTIAKAKERIGASSTTNLIATSVSKGWIELVDDDIPCEYKVVE